MSQVSNAGGYQGRGYGRGGRGNQRWRGGNYRGNYHGNNHRNYGGNYRGNSNRGAKQRGTRGIRNVPQLSQTGRSQPTLLDMPTPYPGWKLYFPDQLYSEQSSIVKRVQAFEKYFISWKATYDSNKIIMKTSFIVDFKELSENQNIKEVIPELASDLRQIPEVMINCLGLSMHQIISHEALCPDDGLVHQTPVENTPTSAEIIENASIPRIHCRIINYEPTTQLRQLKANFYGKFVSVKGTVVRVGNVKPLCTRMAFECSSCSAVQAVVLPDGKYIPPTSCTNPDCKARIFTPLRSHENTETIDWQTIRVQEIMNDDCRESGRIPRTIDCEFNNDLVDSCVPGDMVTVTGIIKVLSSDEGNRGRSKDKCMFLLYLHANSVNNSKGSNSRGAEGSWQSSTSGPAMEFSIKELYAIEEIHSEPNIFKLLVSSICPAIYGHELVKAGLVLGLFGGGQKFVNDKNRIPVRGDPHVLVVGDPGLGKSQMLQAAANVAPRSVYVCGNTTTTSGLTVTLCKEGGGSGDYALEAGALVLADQGCCCIDEFDKMGTQHQALLEAMEQQSISIAKAGIVASLPARTSILAAANPVGGHYNKAKTVSENLKMGSALLSRFDLVFILLDQPDEEMDSMLSEHVMALHAGKKRSFPETPVLQTPQSEEDITARQQWESEKPLSELLKVGRTESIDPIPSPLFRKYVGYAKKYVHSVITPEAAQELQTFYLALRRKHQTQDSTPITTRQLESLIRLTEARARLELREEATHQDAKDVIEIMKYSMIDTYSDEFGFMDFQRSQHGSGMSCKSQAKKFISMLQRLSDQTYNSIYTVQEMRKLAQDGGLQVRDFEDFVSSLNNQGYLLKKGPRVFQLQTAGF